MSPATVDGRLSAGALLAASLGMALVSLDASIVTVALDNIRQDLSATTSALQWVANSYTLAFAGALISAGFLGDKYGAKRIFVAGIVVFTLASVGCGIATSDTVLVVSRIGQGLGAALLASTSLALLTHGYDSAVERSRAVGVWGATGGIALASGPVVGGLLVTVFDWRAVFLINVPIGTAILWLAVRWAKETPAEPRHLDWLGQIFAVVFLVAGTASLIESGHGAWGASTWQILVLTLTFAGGLIGFLWVEARSKTPMVPLGLFANPAFSLMAVAAFLVTASFFGMIFLLSLYFQRVLYMTPLEAGLAFVPMTGLVAIANIMAGRIASRWGGHIPIYTGLSIAVIGYGSFAFLIGPRTTYSDIWWTLILAGAGLALVTPPIISLMMSAVTKRYVGVASGVVNTVRQTGNAFGVAIQGAIGVGGTSIAGVRVALSVTALGLCGALVCAYLSTPAARRL